ncbi:hypothetical protein [Adlercreutzia sp. ZJ304]|uniref:hypothetical protein n=1 Tax=Adlercreutzia sp. ZJ304 TaxID=2709791 RepID=UPI0013EBF21B|nr:hypothetical protein [Adlercreutzia sp. ZJ304]
MEPIKTMDGKVVTEEMLDSFEAALSQDDWADNWQFTGSIIEGAPPLNTANEMLAKTV